jgi:hypothetical protein
MIPRLILLFALIPITDVWCQHRPISKGELDLRNWNSEEHPVLSLDGEWEFYWKELLLSNELQKKRRKTFAQLAKPWNEQKIDGKTFTKNGYATYALTIFLPANMKSVSFAVPAVFNSYSFWVNDKLMCTSGRVGKSREEMIPKWKPNTVTVRSPPEILHVIFQISNFQDTRGGCAEVMRIGNTEYLTGLHDTFHASGIALIVFFGIASLGALVVFFIFRPVSFLYLGLLSMAFTLRFIFSDLYFYHDFGIDLSWLVAAKIEYLTVPLIILSASMFVATIYPQEFKRTILYFFIVTNAVMIPILVFSPSSIFSPLLLVIQVLALAFIVYVMYATVRALIFQRAGAWVSVLGLAVFTSVGFYNVYAFINVVDLNRTVIHIGYASALLLNIISLLYRTPMRILSEEHDTLRFTDLYRQELPK